MQVGAVPRHAVLRLLATPSWQAQSQSALSVVSMQHALFPSRPRLWGTLSIVFSSSHSAGLCFALPPRGHRGFCALPSYHPPSLLSLTSSGARIGSSEGCRDKNSYVPCVVCQQGVNSIDHWLSFCQVPHLTWLALWASVALDMNWRATPSRSTGVALCYLLFHLRRIVTEYGGLQPVMKSVRSRPISQHVLDLWQRIYRSLPSTLLRHFRAPPQATDTACVESTKIKLQRFPTVALESALLPAKGLCTNQAFSNCYLCQE